MSYEVFISHSAKDKKVADLICGFLEIRKIRCWIAPRDLQPGAKWATGIIAGLDMCRTMVLVFSQNSNASEHVAREVERAASKGIVIFPVRIDHSPLAPEMEYFISNTHWLDALTEPVELHLEPLYASVRAQLDVESGPVKGTPPSSVSDGPRPDKPLDRIWWELKRFWRHAVLPTIAYISSLSPAYKLLLASLVVIITILIVISRKVGPPSEADVKANVGHAMESVRMMQQDAMEASQVMNSLQELGSAPASINVNAIQSPWWQKEWAGFQSAIGQATTLRGAASTKEFARLKERKAMLEKWAQDYSRVQPFVRSILRKAYVRAALSKKDERYKKGMPAALDQAVKADQLVDAGKLLEAEKMVGPAARALADPAFPLEQLAVGCVDKASSDYQPSINNREQLDAYIGGLLDAWGKNSRGVHLGMTAKEVKQWAQGLGAVWVDEGNFAQVMGTTNAIGMKFPVPLRKGSLEMEEVALAFTEHFSASRPSVVCEIRVQGQVSRDAIPTPRGIVDERLGKAVRQDAGHLIYCGPELQGIHEWNRYVPAVIAGGSDSQYDISIAAPQLASLCQDEWKALIDRSKTVDELPTNPLLQMPLKVSPKTFKIVEADWTVAAGMPRAEVLEKAEAAELKVTHYRDVIHLFVPSGTISVGFYKPETPNNASSAHFKIELEKPIPANEAIDQYLQRYGPPLDLFISEDRANFTYTRLPNCNYSVELGFDSGICTRVDISANF